MNKLKNCIAQTWRDLWFWITATIGICIAFFIKDDEEDHHPRDK